MTALARIDPRQDLFRDSLPELFRRFTRMADWPPSQMLEELRLDAVEDDKEYRVKVEIPGAKKEDVHISVEGNYVSVTAEVKEEKKETRKQNGERVLLQELRTGSFSRGFTLPQDVDAGRTSAKLENGVLSITLPKREPVAGTRISVQ